MKNTLTTGLMFLLPILALVSCKKDEHELGRLLDKSEIKYEVTQDLVADPGGNTVIMKNLTAETISLWDFGTGTSTRQTDTVRFAFAGDYPIKFSAVTAGGVVTMDSVMVKVTAPNLSYVTDQMWLDISGGIGNEKSWVLDTEGKFFAGPLTYIDPANFSNVWWDAGQDIYPGVMARGDYGVMTFNLKNGAFFSAVKPQEGGVTQSGTYAINVAKKRLTITGGSILRGHKPAQNGLNFLNFSFYEIIAVNENTLRLGVYRDKDPGEGNALLVYNFISKTYSDNYVAPASANP